MRRRQRPERKSRGRAPSVDKVSTAAFAEVRQRLISQPVESPRGNVLFDLTIPACRVELRKPVAEFRQLIRREFLHRLLNFTDAAHRNSSYHRAARSAMPS